MSVPSRRDLLIGAGLAAGAAGAFALTPRDRLVLMPGGRNLEEIVPRRIAGRVDTPSSAFVLPKTPGSLADKLYNELLTRLYLGDDLLPMMVVMAYGAVQNDLLQLHRPEVCYSAVGYQISSSQRAEVPIGRARLPVRELSATSDSRVEAISYWTRIGDDLPTDGNQQRWVKLRQQMHGYLADGILVRISTVAEPSRAVFDELNRFGAALVDALAPADRPALIGRPLARAI